ncbi:hypothetical protein [Acinetobacter sp. ANC 4640]
MRFKTTKFFKVQDLTLDQENYRFGIANTQKECIELIYKDSPDSFENLLNDMITNNIGDYPLVYINPKNENIVLDGNRRVSILKIINDVSLAPSTKIKDIVEKIDKKSLPFDLNNIGCFVSRDKNEILKTVYERHAAGKGISRIHWSAFATAKFRYDSKIEDTDWRAIAILLHVISIDVKSNTFVNSPRFSFEVFKRLVRHGYNNGYIHFNVFNEDKMILNSESKYFDTTILLINEFIKSMDNNEVNLSRGDNYASDSFLKEYFAYKFSKITTEKPPRRRRKKEEDKPITYEVSSTSTDAQPVTQSQSKKNPNEIKTSSLPASQSTLPFIEKKPKLEIPDIPSFIAESPELIGAINSLSVQKFSLLYQSLTQLNIRKHAIIAVVATWSFLDSLPRLANWNGTDFTAYYNNHIKSFTESKEQQTAIRHSLTWLSNEGNCNKHSGQYVTLDHKEFVKHFNNIQVFLSQVIIKSIKPIMKQ